MNSLIILTSYKRDILENNNKTLETNEDNNELSLEQKSIDTMDMDALQRELDLLEEHQIKVIRSYLLLYKYEPYYIYEGWNYMEKYTPEVK